MRLLYQWKFMLLVLIHSLLTADCDAQLLDLHFFNSALFRDYYTLFSWWMYGVDLSERILSAVPTSEDALRYTESQFSSEESPDFTTVNSYANEEGDTVTEERAVHLKFTPLPYPQSNTQTASGEPETWFGWFDPRVYGGRMLDYTGYLGEPLNVIISNRSDPYILTDAGLLAYSRSLGFAHECFDLHFGEIHRANIGDGEGEKDQQFLMREYYMPVIGTCVESLIGGNHFRAWHQNGSLASSDAWFLGVSKEEDSSKSHMIAKDGYNRGRDLLVSRAVFGTHWRGMWWKADLEWNEGDLLSPGSNGVNHGIAQDGRVAILTVERL